MVLDIVNPDVKKTITKKMFRRKGKKENEKQNKICNKKYTHFDHTPFSHMKP